MARDRLSKRSVDRLTCPAGQDRVFLWDDALAGFGVAAFPTGRKVYVVQFRKSGRSRRATIGDHGRLTPEQARSEAKKLLGGVERGQDPIAERKAARAVLTFNAMADRFVAEHLDPKRKPRTVAYYRDVLDRHVRPALGSKRLTDITHADAARLHAGLRGTPTTANRAIAILSSAWSWAAKQGETTTAANPVTGMERYAEQGRERFLSTAELGRLGDALNRAEGEGLPFNIDESRPTAKHAPKGRNRLRQLDPFAVAAIRLLILTGARVNEILHAEWRHVDIERGILHLPDSKTGKKPVFLSAAAMAVLSTLPRLNSNPHVIAGAKEGMPRRDLNKPWAAVRKAAKLDGLRLHDLRHSFASVGAGASLGLPILGKLLGHSQPATTAKYAHLDADPMRRAVNIIGETIAAALAGTGAAPAPPSHATGRRP